MILKLKTSPAVEPVSLTEVMRQVRLDFTEPEQSSGNLVVGAWYQITATQANYFYAGCAVGDTWRATAATALTAANKVIEIVEGAYFNSLIKAAGQHIESLCGPLITQTWYQYENDWPAGDVLSIGKPRLQSITAITYTDVDSVTATLASSNYAVDVENEYSPRVVLEDDGEWPSIDLHPKNPIRVEFICGYGDETTDIPEPIRIAILMLVAHWYENREPVSFGQNVTSLPFAIDALIANYRVWGF